MGAMNVQHSSATNEWGTPPSILAMVREVLGPIDFDPASSVRWNAAVEAKRFLTEKDDGLSAPWLPGTLYCNPPGGKIGNQSKTSLFWQRLMRHRDEGELEHAIFMAFSAEALQNTQGKGVLPIMAFPFCVPAKRIRFVAVGVEKFQPSHSNVIAYVPGKLDLTGRFQSVFSQLGWCTT